MFGVIMPLCNRMFCCTFGWYFYIEIRLKYEKKNILLSSSRAFSLYIPTFHCLPLWTTVRLHGKKLQNATKHVIVFGHGNLMPLHTLHQSRGKSGHTKTLVGMRKTRDCVWAWKPYALTAVTKKSGRDSQPCFAGHFLIMCLSFLALQKVL